MLRTGKIESDVRGRARSIVWEADELGMVSVTIAGGARARTEPFYAEGFRHFHVYVGRTATRPLDIYAIPYQPIVQTGAPVEAGVSLFNIATWNSGAASGTFSVFYFGEQRQLTDGKGARMMFSPIMAIEIENNGANPTDVTVFVHGQD